MSSGKNAPRQKPKSLRGEQKQKLEVKTVINRPHIMSPGAQHPNSVASKNLGLTDQEPQMQNMCFPLSPLPQGNPYILYNTFALHVLPSLHRERGT